MKHKTAYSRLVYFSKKKKKTCDITIEQFEDIRSKPCETCGKYIEDTGIGLILINPRKHYTLDNIKVCCKICQLEGPRTKFDIIKHAKNQLRRNWKRTPMALTALQRAKRKGGYECAVCGKICKAKEFDLDHIQPTVSVDKLNENDLNLFVKNLFCHESNLQVLCKEHHIAKTKGENLRRNVIDKENKK